VPALGRLVMRTALYLMPRKRGEAMRRFAAYVLLEPC
jgi:hypothetical protein